jgi:2-iminobutanoate/2-iminopropanoate deaminase
MERQVINPEGLPDSEQFAYSQAIIANGTLYASGQPAWNTEFEIEGDDIESQTRKALENIGVLLDAIDKDYDDITKVTSYIVNPQDRLEVVITVWQEFFDAPYPCHTTIGVDQLAMDGFLIELEIEIPVTQ